LLMDHLMVGVFWKNGLNLTSQTVGDVTS